MPSEIRMPKLGMSMTEGTLVAWVVADGHPVTAGEVVATIETDKVEQEIEAPDSGTLAHRATTGTTYDVGELLAEIA